MGEILLSLSYLPTAERLTVVVVKAKNLVWTNGKVTAGERGPADPRTSAGWRWAFTRVYPARPERDLPERLPLLEMPQQGPPEVATPSFSTSQRTRVTDPGVPLSPTAQIPSSRCTCCRTGGRSARRRQR